MNLILFNTHRILFEKFSTLVLTEKLQPHFYAQSQKHSTVTSQTQVSVIQSQNQQQPIVSIQHCCFNIAHSLNVLQFNHKTYQ